MRLSIHVPGATGATVVLDGRMQPRCFLADDVLGIALCGVQDANGNDIYALLHRDWQEGEVEWEGLLARWQRGAVEFRFESPDQRTEAEAHWREHVARDAGLWAMGERAAQEPPV